MFLLFCKQTNKMKWKNDPSCLKTKISAEEEDEEACRSAEDSWGPHPSIHCSHCFHSSSDSGWKQTKKAKMEEKTALFLTVFRLRVFFLQLHSHVSAPCQTSDSSVTMGMSRRAASPPSKTTTDRCRAAKQQTLPKQTVHSRVAESRSSQSGSERYITNIRLRQSECSMQ